MEDAEYTVYVGIATRNPGPGAYGAVVTKGDLAKAFVERFERDDHTLEDVLVAAVGHALRVMEARPTARIAIATDSRHTVDRLQDEDKVGQSAVVTAVRNELRNQRGRVRLAHVPRHPRLDEASAAAFAAAFGPAAPAHVDAAGRVFPGRAP